MPNDNAIKFGILKCRDLVELYYGARMVTSIVEKSFPASATPFVLFGADPRRIRYEIWADFSGIGGNSHVQIGTPAAIDSGAGQAYDGNSTGGLVVERDFLTDFDAVCLAQSISDPSGTILFSTRETFLTPIPVDEMP